MTLDYDWEILEVVNEEPRASDPGGKGRQGVQVRYTPVDADEAAQPIERFIRVNWDKATTQDELLALAESAIKRRAPQAKWNQQIEGERATLDQKTYDDFVAGAQRTPITGEHRNADTNRSGHGDEVSGQGGSEGE